MWPSYLLTDKVIHRGAPLLNINFYTFAEEDDDDEEEEEEPQLKVPRRDQ